MRNQVNLIGIVGKNLNIKEFQPGKKRAFFNLRIEESYKNKEGKIVYRTTPVNLIAWGKNAEIVEKYVEVGHELVVEAKIKINNYKNSKGDMIYDNQIMVTEIYFLPENFNRKEKIIPEKK